MRSLKLLFAALLFFVAAPLFASIPAGTTLNVRLDRTVSSRTARVGDRVACSLADDLVVNDRVIARRGHRLRAVVTYARRSGRLHDPGYVTVRLESIRLGRHYYRLHSTAIRDEGHGHTKSNVEKIGGGAGVGTLIGAIAGGGKGALIGGLLGAGGGTALAAGTGRKPGVLPAESVYQFQLTSTAH